MDFSIRNEYEQLAAKDLKFPLIDELKAFKTKALMSGSNDYAYKADLLIADVYLEHGSFDEPLKLLLSVYKEIDSSIYPKIYLDFIDRILYIYITKKNYRLALLYTSKKEKLIDPSSPSQRNRLLLEKSHIYNQMNENDKAITCLEEILTHPTEEVKKYALNNITSLYIDKKNVNEAEKYLEECLNLNDDEEGKVYCNYLLAKICILKENYTDGLVLLKEIFENEDINMMTLPMVNEYLDLLYQLKRFDEMELVISKIALFVNASDDLYIQKQFCKNKIKYLVATKNMNQLQDIMDEYETIDKKIIEQEKKDSLEINKLENDEHVDDAIGDMVTSLDQLVTVFHTNGSYPSLRDLILDFSKTLQNAISFDEASFVLLQRPFAVDFLPDDDFKVYYYAKNRLLEKNLSESVFPGSLTELVMNQNKPLGFDLKKNKLHLNNLFFNKDYLLDGLNYVYALPINYEGKLFGVLTFASSQVNITDKQNCIFFDFASRVFESAIITYYIHDLYQMNKTMIDKTIMIDNIGFIKFNDEDMYLSNSLVATLKQQSNMIKRRTYLHYISRNDIDRYMIETEKDSYRINYKLTIGSLFVSVYEVVETYFDNENKKCFKYGTISIDEGSIKSLIDGKKLLENKLKEYEQQIYSNLEFKFSFVRIKTSPSEYENIRKVFGSVPYYLSDSDCVLLLENEVNLNDIMSRIHDCADEYTIIRYPRDVMDLSLLLDSSRIMLDNGQTVYNQEVYKKHLKEQTINKLALGVLNNPTQKPQLAVVRYNSYLDDLWIEPSLYFEMDNNTDYAIRDLLNEENRMKYDIKLFRSIIDNNITINTLLFISSKSLKRLLDKQYITPQCKNIYFVLSDMAVNDINGLISAVSKNANVVVEGNIFKYISAFNLDNKNVKGVYLTAIPDLAERDRVVRLATIFKLDIFSPRFMNGLNRLIYASGKVDIVK